MAAMFLTNMMATVSKERHNQNLSLKLSHSSVLLEATVEQLKAQLSEALGRCRAAAGGCEGFVCTFLHNSQCCRVVGGCSADGTDTPPRRSSGTPASLRSSPAAGLRARAIARPCIHTRQEPRGGCRAAGAGAVGARFVFLDAFLYALSRRARTL